MTAARPPEKKRSRVARLAARLFGSLRFTDQSQTAEKCLNCSRACKATRAEALELSSGVSERFAEGLGKADGEWQAEACHCEQTTALYRRLWDSDDCTEADIAIGLAVAMPAYRYRQSKQLGLHDADAHLPILVVPLPGEAHLLSALLAASALEGTGRRIDFRVPVSLGEMCSYVEQRRYAGVVVVTSPVFSRSSRRAFIEACGAALHSASEQPLRVVLCGRIAEESDADSISGIDATTSCTDRLPAEFEHKVLRIH